MKSTNFGAAIWGLDWADLKTEAGIQGTANLEEDGIVLDIPFGWIFWNGGIVIPESAQKLPKESEYLYGFTQKGDWIVLKDCFPLSGSSSFPGGKRQKVSANYLFSSRKQFDPSENIIEIEIGLVGFAEWFGEIPLIQTFDDNTFWFKSLEFDVEKSKRINEVLFEDDLYKLVVDHAYKASPIRIGGFTFSHESFLRVCLKKGMSFVEARELIFKLQNYFVLSMGFFCEIDFLRFKFENSESPIDCYGNFYKGKEPTDRQLREMPFPRRRILGLEQIIFKNYLYASGDYLEALSLVSSLIGKNWDLPTSLEALAASQCLEAISRIGANLNSINPDEYELIIKTIKSSISDSKAQRWISERMPGNTKGQKRLLVELADRYKTAFKWAVSDSKYYIEQQVALRNELAHARGTNSLEKSKKQYWHTKTTVLLSFFIIWEMMGLSSKDIIDAFGESGFMSYTLDSIKDNLQ